MSEASETRPVTILGRPVKPEHVQHLVRFYEADHRLTPQDRQQLAQDLASARNTAMLWGMFDCTCALLAPTVYKRIAERKAKAPPAGVRRPVFHRPFISSVFATGIYFCSAYFHSRSEQESRIRALEGASQDAALADDVRAARRRMLDVWRSLEPAQLALFSFYYQETVRDPAHVMQDPRSMFSADPHSVVYVPPSETPAGGVAEKTAPHWEKIREQNGYVRAGAAAAPGRGEGAGPDGAANAAAADTSARDAEPEPEAQSAWERLRRGAGRK